MNDRPQGSGASAPKPHRRGIQVKADISETNLPGNSPPIKLPISSLMVDIEIQQRARMDDALIAEYAVDIANWISSAPIDVFADGESRWVADGFHRVEAALTAGLDAIFAHQRKGTRRDALLFAVAANQRHGLRRTNADKRRAVETLLSDPEWSSWSDRRIADQAGVSAPMVASVRERLRCKTFTPESQQTAPTESLQVSTVDTWTVGAIRRDRLTWGNPPPGTPSVSQADPTADADNEPAKRIGRDGKSYSAPPPKPDPEPVIVEAVEGDDLDAVRSATTKLQAQTAPKAPVGAPPDPAPTTPTPKAPTAKEAMHAAHGVASALGLLRKVEGALLESDARTLIGELRKALDRLTARFEQEGTGHA